MSKNITLNYKTALKSLNWIALLTICLTASSCLTKGDVPPLPTPNKFQPIIEQVLCDDNGKNCVLKSVCKEWAIDPANNQWVLVQNHPIKKCHGLIGVTADGYNQYREYHRIMTDWLPNHCKIKKDKDKDEDKD